MLLLNSLLPSNQTYNTSLYFLSIFYQGQSTIIGSSSLVLKPQGPTSEVCDKHHRRLLLFHSNSYIRICFSLTTRQGAKLGPLHIKSHVTEGKILRRLVRY